MPDNARMIVGTLGLVNALVCLGVGSYFYIAGGMGLIFSMFLIPEGYVMLLGAYCLYKSRYVIGGLLILAPGLYVGYLSWVMVFQYLLLFPAEIAWGLAFAIPIAISTLAFLIHVRKWYASRKHRQ